MNKVFDFLEKNGKNCKKNVGEKRRKNYLEKKFREKKWKILKKMFGKKP